MRNAWLALGAALLLAGCGGAGPSHGTAARGKAEHFTMADLERLGCTVDATPKTHRMDMPLVGPTEMYGFTSDAPCASMFISILQQSDGHDEGIWAGIGASAGTFARKHGYERERRAGEIGEYSEIEVFSRDGVEKGFRYSVEANGYLRSVTLISDSIGPGGAFEDALEAKL